MESFHQFKTTIQQTLLLTNTIFNVKVCTNLAQIRDKMKALSPSKGPLDGAITL